MKLDPFEKRMVVHVLNQKPIMTIRGTLMIIVLILTLIYAAIDSGLF